MKKRINSFLKAFKPRYSVKVTMYHVIPGSPVNKLDEHHQFDKGEFESAKEFYKKVVQKTGQIKLAPAEIHLIKGRKKIMHKSEFGPVTRIKKELRMSA